MMIEKRTVCPYDCPDSCGMIATIKGGKVVSVRGDQEHPRTKGFLCRKTAHYEKFVNHPDRILYPMKRTGEKGKGEFTRITWDEAMELIASKWKEIIAQYGPEAILPYSYAGTEGMIQKNCGMAFFHYLGASKLKRTICASGKSAGWDAVMGESIAMRSEQVADCDRLLVWSSNLPATRIHEIPYVNQARKNGAKVTLIDVYSSPSAAYCDDVILIRPGSDGALALAMIHVLEEEGLTDKAYIEEYVQGYDLLLKELPGYTPEWAEEKTGIPAEVIRDLAISYGKAKRPGIIFGNGASRHKNGAMNVRCVCALPATVGSWKNGFGILGTNQGKAWGDVSKVTRPDFDKNNARSINMMQLAMALDTEITMDPPVKSMYVYHSNPMNVTTNQAKLMELMKREDLFTVVHERFMTDTALYADVILPAVVSLESDDIFCGYGSNIIQYAKKAVDAPGECLSNWDTFVLLAKAMGFEDPYFSMTERDKCMEFLDRKTGQQTDLSDEEWNCLMEGKAIDRPLAGPLEILTESGKIEFYNSKVKDPLIGYREERPTQKGWMHLAASPSVYSLNSTFTSQADLVEKRGKMSLIISQAEAKKRGIEHGDRIICRNELAEVEFFADVREGVPENTVVAEGVYDMAHSLNGKTVNALFSEELSDLGEATTMNGNSAEVLKKPE